MESRATQELRMVTKPTIWGREEKPFETWRPLNGYQRGRLLTYLECDATLTHSDF